jgi:hypothetical protein
LNRIVDEFLQTNVSDVVERRHSSQKQENEILRRPLARHRRHIIFFFCPRFGVALECCLVAAFVFVPNFLIFLANGRVGASLGRFRSFAMARVKQANSRLGRHVLRGCGVFFCVALD